MQKKYILILLTPLLNFNVYAKTRTPQIAKAPKVAITANTVQPTLTPALKKSATKRTVTITNSITPAMRIKKHWTGEKTPDKLAILLDGKQIEPGKTVSAQLKDDLLTLEFDYSFMNGYRTGKNQVIFQVPEDQERLDMTFSWENDFRVILDKAIPKTKEAIEKREISKDS